MEDSPEKLLKRFVSWAATQTDIVAVINQGSRARKDHPADEWSDLDLIVYTTNKDRYLNNPDWLANIGNVIITFLEETATGKEFERRALFQDGIDADFSIISTDRLVDDVKEPSPEDQDMIRRGVRVLVDKSGVLAKLPEGSKEPVRARSRPSEKEFDQVVNDFLYHIVWAAKKLRRGELWTAKACCDGYMKRRLLTMIEWHTLAHKGWSTDIWFNGRFLEEWTDPKIVRRLHDTFAHYNYEDVKKALFGTGNLFVEIARETARKLGYDDTISQAQPVFELAASYLRPHGS